MHNGRRDRGEMRQTCGDKVHVMVLGQWKEKKGKDKR